jgi:uncharacterized protein
MKFAIVSDTHDNIKNFNKVIGWLNKEKVAMILHCGDICNQEIIKEGEANFRGKIIYVRGNGDYELPEIPETMDLELGGKKVFFNHYPDIAKRAAESGKYDLVFYGHTHKPWEEKVGKCRLVNPGELAGQRYKSTFAIYDTQTDKLELKVLEKLL